MTHPPSTAIVGSVFSLMFYALISAAGQPRVIATSPQLTELAFQVGADQTLVGASSYSFYPPAAAKLPKIGGATTLSLERVLRLAPSWVLVDAQATPDDFTRTLERFAVPLTRFEMQSIQGMFEAGAAIAERLRGRGSYWRTALECFKETKKDPPFSFLAIAWAEPLVVFGPRTFLSDLLVHLGGSNVAPSTANRFPSVSEEFVAVKSPDVVFYPDDQTEAVGQLTRRWWNNPRLVPIRDRAFFRASLSPIRKLGLLNAQWEGRSEHCLKNL